MDSSWQPTAELNTLVQRDRLLQALRRYFTDSGSLEVQTPALSAAGTTDPHIDSFSVAVAEAGGSPVYAWLHTSPEFAMKRLLAAHANDIHQFATVFRYDESGKHHLREFTLLEWYRVGYRLSDLLNDALNIVNAACAVMKRSPVKLNTVSYQDEVKRLCGVYPHDVTLPIIEKVFDHQHRSFPDSLRVPEPTSSDVSDALTLLVDEFVVRNFSSTELTALIEYPADQASLAKLGYHEDGHAVACRAELFFGAVELANGFEELTDADEQSARFKQDNAIRAAKGKTTVPHDERLIDALHEGLPDCAGMALGIDRLLMVLGGYTHLSQVVAFADSNA